MNHRPPTTRRVVVGTLVGFVIILAISLTTAITVGDGQSGLIIAAVFLSVVVGGGLGGLIAARTGAAPHLPAP